MQTAAVWSGAIDSDLGLPPDIGGLTRRMVAGNAAAYFTFYRTYYDRLLRYLLVVAHGDEGAAREALQATLLRVVRHIRVFPDEAVFWSWLTVVARSALADQGRKHRRYLAFLGRFTEHWRIEKAASKIEPANTDLLVRLEQSLASLPAKERDLIERKYFDGEPVRHIAEAMGTTEKAVESRLVRIRRRLKQMLLQSLKHECSL